MHVLERLVQAVKDAGIANETVIIVTADHGGKDKGHGGKSLDEVLIPWVVYGRRKEKSGTEEYNYYFTIPELLLHGCWD